MLPGLTSVTLKSYRLAAACAAPTRWKDIWPPCPHDLGSASVDTTAPANASPSTPMPSSVSTTKRCSGPLPYTFDVPSTTRDGAGALLHEGRRPRGHRRSGGVGLAVERGGRRRRGR